MSETAPIVVQTPQVAGLWREEDRSCEYRIALLRSTAVREAEKSSSGRKAMQGYGGNTVAYLYTVKGNH